LTNSKRNAALAALVAAMTIWGSTFVVTKVAMQEFPPLTLAFLRFAIASCVLLAVMRGFGALVKLRAISLWRLIFLATSGIALFTAGFNLALLYGSAAQGALLYATIPAVVAISAVLFLNETLDRRRVLGIALSVGGAAIIVLTGEASFDSAPKPLLAAGLMLWTVILWGAYTVAAKPIAAADHTVVIFAICAIGSLLLLPASIVELALGGWPETSGFGWAGVLYLGLFASAACYALYQFALRELDASTVGVFTNIDPVVGLVTAFVFLGEGLSMGQAGGALVVLAGMWLASAPARERV
jgi:drug/metabolite transporter (DMT)-like permease